MRDGRVSICKGFRNYQKSLVLQMVKSLAQQQTQDLACKIWLFDNPLYLLRYSCTNKLMLPQLLCDYCNEKVVWWFQELDKNRQCW